MRLARSKTLVQRNTPGTLATRAKGTAQQDAAYKKNMDGFPSHMQLGTIPNIAGGGGGYGKARQGGLNGWGGASVTDGGRAAEGRAGGRAPARLGHCQQACCTRVGRSSMYRWGKMRLWVGNLLQRRDAREEKEAGCQRGRGGRAGVRSTNTEGGEALLRTPALCKTLARTIDSAPKGPGAPAQCQRRGRPSRKGRLGPKARLGPICGAQCSCPVYYGVGVGVAAGGQQKSVVFG